MTILELKLLKNKRNILSITIYLLVTLLPLLAGLVYAILNSFGLTGILSNGFTLGHWQTFFGSNEFGISFLYSLGITGIIIIISVVVALAISINYTKNIDKGKSAYLFYIPLALPYIVAGFVTYQLFNPTGLFSRIAYFFHISSSPETFPDLTNDALSFGIIITHVVIASTFFSILFAGIFKNEKLIELADIAKGLGAKNSQVTKKVIIPIILKKAFPSIVLYGIFTLGSYEIPLLLGRQTPQFISVVIANKFQRFNLQDVPLAYCMAIAYTVLIVIILFYLTKKKKLYHENN